MSLELAAERLNVARSYAEQLSASGVEGSPAELSARILAGFEMGLEPMEAVAGLYLVDGQVVMRSQLMHSQLLRGGVEVSWGERSDDRAEVTLLRGGQSHFEEWTMEQARVAGLAGLDHWLKYPGKMLESRALSAAARAFCPDLLRSCYTTEERKSAKATANPGRRQANDARRDNPAAYDQAADAQRVKLAADERLFEAWKVELDELAGEGKRLARTPEDQRDASDLDALLDLLMEWLDAHAVEWHDMESRPRARVWDRLLHAGSGVGFEADLRQLTSKCVARVLRRRAVQSPDAVHYRKGLRGKSLADAFGDDAEKLDYYMSQLPTDAPDEHRRACADRLDTLIGMAAAAEEEAHQAVFGP